MERDLDLIAQMLQPVKQSVRHLLPLTLVKIIAPQILVGLVAKEHIIHGHDDGVCHGTQGTFPSPTSCQPIILRPQIAFLRACRSIGRLNEAHTQGPDCPDGDGLSAVSQRFRCCPVPRPTGQPDVWQNGVQDLNSLPEAA